LKELVRAQTCKIPFENISKLFYKKHLNLRHLIGFDLFLDGIEKYHFGGTCYSINFYLYQLLDWLGYDVRLCGADMAKPDVHIVNVVKIGNREYLVDAGYAALFTEPVPLDLPDKYIVPLGRDQYVLQPRDPDNVSTMELYRQGVLKHGYRINPMPRKIDDFQQVISDSFKEDATFMNSLLLTRFIDDHFVVVHNLKMIKYAGSVINDYQAHTIGELASMIDQWFGIPEKLVYEVLKDLHFFKDAWTGE